MTKPNEEPVPDEAVDAGHPEALARLTNHMIELESLYLSLRDRIDEKMRAEYAAGEQDPSVRMDMETATRILMEYARLQHSLGIGYRGRGAGKRPVGG